MRIRTIAVLLILAGCTSETRTVTTPTPTPSPTRATVSPSLSSSPRVTSTRRTSRSRRTAAPRPRPTRTYTISDDWKTWRPSAYLSAILACIRKYEGGYRSVSSGGTYHGAYQMNEDFWLTYGGDPIYVNPDRWEQAPPRMQDWVAARGFARRGLSPWPTPSRRCAYLL